MTPWRVRWSPGATRDLRRLDTPTIQRVRSAVRRYAEAGLGDVKKLAGPGDEWRLRVGRWRVRFHLHPAGHEMEILRVLPRPRAYRD